MLSMQTEAQQLPQSPAGWRRWLPTSHVGYVWLVALIVSITMMKDTERYNRADVLVWDAGGYYLYLPATFITHDLGDGSYLSYVRKEYRSDLNPEYGYVRLPNGRMVFKYPMGLAVAYAPWFGLAHAYAPLKGFPQDGYSKPYQRYVAWGCFLYGLLGLLMLGRELRHYVPDHLAALTLLVIGLGTNLFIYATHEAQMAHCTLFLLNVLLLRFTRQWYATGRWLPGLALALVFGMMLLTRPSELWMIAVPLLWGLTSRAAVAQRLRFWLSKWPQLLTMTVLVILIGGMQLLFWRVVGGSWLLDFYPGETFNFLQPHLLDGLFSARKGWLFWSPLLAFALLGIAWLRRTAPAVFPVAVVLVPAVIYITFSWWDWTYGGGFGCRPLISLYPLLGICLASFWARWWRKAAVPLAVVVGLLVLLNLRQSWQYTHGIVDCCNMDWARYKKYFFEPL